MNTKFSRLATGALLVLLLGAGTWWRSLYIRNPACQGGTMGTAYHIRIAGLVKQSELRQLTERIESTLAEVSRQMSTWDPDSEISRFNNSSETGPFHVSKEFATVLRKTLELSAETGGTFDPTLQPLLNLWGFGSGGDGFLRPSPEQIAATRRLTGWEKIWFDDEGNLWKTEPGVQLALGAIAKGYGVDALGDVLNKAGFENWFVEIGGEVSVKGLNPDGVPWKIGIQLPTYNPMEEGIVHGIANLTSGAVATSGDYRNYITVNNVVYSHILDPRSGEIVLSDTASVSVVAGNCMEADGMATALFVMDPDAGIAWVEGVPDVEVLYLIRAGNGEFIEKFSSGFTETARYIQVR